jgi:surfactin synthase thioesterase subunit
VTGTGLSNGALLRHEPSDATMRLVCLPHAGAGATSFTRWLELFPPWISAVRVQLPGREDVAARPPFRRVSDAVDALLPQVMELDAPVAMYGHSMGALVGFELVRALRAEGRPPLHFFVSGRRAPHLPARKATIHHLPDDEFMDALQAMGGAGGLTSRSRAFQRYATRLIKADLELSEEHTHRPEPRLPCPITAFYGTEDPIVDEDQVEAWQEHTDAAFEVHTFPGDHFFHQHHRAAIARTIAYALE